MQYSLKPSSCQQFGYRIRTQRAPNEHLLGSVARESLALMAGIWWDLGDYAVGAIPKAKDDVIDESKRYIDYLYQSGKLELPPHHQSFPEFEFDSYDGLGIHQANTPQYRELFNYLNESRRKADADRQPEIAEELLANMMEDPSLFLNRICMTNHEENEFYNVPVLASLEPQRFVEKLLDLHPQRQRIAMLALKSRYEHGRLDRDLAAEREWATNVRNLLLSASEGMSPIAKERLRGLVTYGLNKVLGIQAEKL